MRIQRSSRSGKVRYAGFDCTKRVTQWLPSPKEVESQFSARCRDGQINPLGLDIFLKDTLSEELREFEIEVEFTEDLSPAEQLSYALVEMRKKGVPRDIRERFTHVATCTPNSDAKWVLAE